MQQLTSSCYNGVQKILDKLCKLRKSCNRKRNINGIYNDKAIADIKT